MLMGELGCLDKAPDVKAKTAAQMELLKLDHTQSQQERTREFDERNMLPLSFTSFKAEYVFFSHSEVKL